MKKGDTLIEVAIAIGIFSMVAVTVIGVVSSSTSSAQSSLETTVTREIIDAQAEALRFIQSAYIAGGRANIYDENNVFQKYASVWDEITKYAINPDAVTNSAEANDILRFNPTTCADAFNRSRLSNQGAFIVNTRMLGNIDADRTSVKNMNKIIINARTDSGLFYETTTYPRILYKGLAGEATSEALLDDGYDTQVLRIEGIYIVAVKDSGTTIVSGGTGGSDVSIDERSAYYDFYIRTCWYNPGASTPSTISTVIRLQDPATINYGTEGAISKRLIITFDKNADDATGYMPTQSIKSGQSAYLLENGYAREGYRFIGWSVNKDGTGAIIEPSSLYTAPALSYNKSRTLYAVWEKL